MDALYTWKDAERKIRMYFSKNIIPSVIDIDVYYDEIVIVMKKSDNNSEADILLDNVFGRSYDASKKRLYLDLSDTYMNVDIEVEDEEKKVKKIRPLFHDVIYRSVSYDEGILNDSKLDKCPVVAFHSYKGGVGRTLSLLAFVKAWSCNKPDEQLLIVDSDLEAPGLTWLLEKNTEGERFSYLDLLELIQGGQMENEEIIKDVVGLIGDTNISVDTGRVIVQHPVLPTYRYEEQLLDVYSSPESIVRGNKSRYVLAETLSMLGEKMGASAVLVDLRAGVSEFSAPLILDPRVKKYLVTSTSFQSIQGTKTLLKQICKGLPISEEGIMPEILLTMVPDGVETTEIKSELIQEYSIPETDSSYTDNVVTELPFASELIHLTSLGQIFKVLEGRDFYKGINEIVVNHYMESDKTESAVNNREKVVNEIHKLAENQITAEGSGKFAVLLTQPIHNLLKKFSHQIPQAVVLGAKGAGKTFLFKEMISRKTWQEFAGSFDNTKHTDITTYIIPLITSKSLDGFENKIRETLSFFSKNVSITGKNELFWYENIDILQEFSKEIHDRREWKELWIKCICGAFNKTLDLALIDKELQEKEQRVLFVADGLEEIFEKTLESENEKFAIQALVQDVLNEFKIKYNNLGLLVFLRKDLANNSITTNYEQFENQYRSIVLNWSHEEALKLALWLVSRAVPEFCADIELDNISNDAVEKKLNRLWGVKLGKNSSNEAYSSRWILAALSDFNSQLQARDIIRFLQNATSTLGKNTYPDRYIMPTEIKNAVQKCSKAKIEEIKQEMAALRPILQELEDAPADKKVLPFKADTFNWNVNQEKILKQEGFLIVDNDKYYLPEIIRHALGFKYEKGARPKVLSLLLKK